MLLHIIARGKIGRSPEAELVDRYVKRLTMPHKITEMPDRGGKLPPQAPGTVTVMLDEKGKQLSSMDFARRIEGWRDAGTRECRFLIGAAGLFKAPSAIMILPLWCTLLFREEGPKLKMFLVSGLGLAAALLAPILFAARADPLRRTRLRLVPDISNHSIGSGARRAQGNQTSYGPGFCHRTGCRTPCSFPQPA